MGLDCNYFEGQNNLSSQSIICVGPTSFFIL